MLAHVWGKNRCVAVFLWLGNARTRYEHVIALLGFLLVFFGILVDGHLCQALPFS